MALSFSSVVVLFLLFSSVYVRVLVCVGPNYE